MKLTALSVANSLGLDSREFIHKKSQKTDPKKTVLKVDNDERGSVRLAAFRKLTGLKPIVVKKGSSRLVAVFATAALGKKKIDLPVQK